MLLLLLFVIDKHYLLFQLKHFFPRIYYKKQYIYKYYSLTCSDVILYSSYSCLIFSNAWSSVCPFNNSFTWIIVYIENQLIVTVLDTHKHTNFRRLLYAVGKFSVVTLFKSIPSVTFNNTLRSSESSKSIC